MKKRSQQRGVGIRNSDGGLGEAGENQLAKIRIKVLRHPGQNDPNTEEFGSGIMTEAWGEGRAGENPLHQIQ